MKKIKVINVVGARPNFMKIAPIIEEMRRNKRHFSQILLHTGQHYDGVMSDKFFQDLNLPKPDIYLGVGSATHAKQTAEIMSKFERVCLKQKPNLIIVVGDVNSTLACSLVAAKLLIPVAHIEAGLRSFDRTMPEEINRIITDSLSEHLFTTCEDAGQNLRKEGVPPSKIHFVGNVMIDTLLRYRNKVKKSRILNTLSIKKGCYGVLTLHRPSNVDKKKHLKQILIAIGDIANQLPIVFPVHPRTDKQIKKFGLKKYLNSNMKSVQPLGYYDFLHLMANSSMILTDSGGIQEETTILGLPCLTLRKNTERRITVSCGTNTIVEVSPARIRKEAFRIIAGKGKKGKIPKFWDGKAAKRIVSMLKSRYFSN